MFDVETVFSIILPVSTKLCNDNVYAVRKAVIIIIKIRLQNKYLNFMINFQKVKMNYISVF